MSDGPEQYSGGDQGSEQVSDKALEAFREQMRASGRQAKQIQKREKKKKKKEDRLAKMIGDFIQKRAKREIAILIARVLALNVPPIVVLSMLLIGDVEGMAEVIAADAETDSEEKEKRQMTEIVHDLDIDESELGAITGENEELVQQVKHDIVIWIQFVNRQASTEPIRTLERCMTEEGYVQPAILDLVTTVMRHYGESQGVNIDETALARVAELVVLKVLEQINHNIDRLKDIREKEFEPPPES